VNITPPVGLVPKGAGSANYAADYVMEVLDDVVGTIDSDIVVSTTLEPSMQAAADARSQSITGRKRLADMAVRQHRRYPPPPA
jgi:membrane peptidoglycan carboxypeptidase